jgi:hypothetical protein
VKRAFGKERFPELGFDVSISDLLDFLMLEIEKNCEEDDDQKNGPEEILRFFFDDGPDQPDDTNKEQAEDNIFQCCQIHLSFLTSSDQYFSKKSRFFLYSS